jgi:hypothetical protein
MAKTVLVLGAGASWDYGLPTGEQLLDQAIELCRDAGRTADAGKFSSLVCTGPSPPINGWQLALTQFASLLQGQLPPSIDWFLGQDFDDARRPGFRRIGLLAIAWLIGNSEQAEAKSKEPKLRPTEPDEKGRQRPRPHWYRTFWRSLGVRSAEDFEKIIDEERLRIVTFNYDRSFDQFLFKRLAALHAARAGTFTEASLQQKLAKLFVHVYGDLGSLDELPYGAIASATTEMEWRHMVTQASQRLQVVEEHRKDEEQKRFVKAQSWIQAADKIVFLGFGFDPTNLERLGFPNLRKPVRGIFATTYGLAPVQRQEVCEALITSWASSTEDQRQRCNIQDAHQTMTVDDYLWHYQPFKNLAR